MKTVLLASLLMLVVIFSGCQEQQATWGQGDPPADWQDRFGNDNIARLNFVQTNAINQQRARIYGTDPNDPGIIVYVNALGGRVTALKELTTVLAKQVGDLIKLNSQQHKKLGETDIRFHKRIEGLEGEDEITQEEEAALVRGTLYRLDAMEKRLDALENNLTGWRSPESIAIEMLGKDAILYAGPIEGIVDTNGIDPSGHSQGTCAVLHTDPNE